jgi:hypothetical protein
MLIALYELSLVLLALVVGATFARRCKEWSAAECLASVLLAKYLIGGFIPLGLTALGWNSPHAYAAVMVAAFTVAALNAELVIECVRRAFPQIGLAFALMVPPAFILLAGNIAPLIETDSLVHADAIVEWAYNRAGVYSFPNNYVAFWELQFVPHIALGGGLQHVWLLTLQPVLLIAVLLSALLTLSGVGGYLRALAVASVIFLPLLWWGPSGVATLKNDTIASAGLLAAVLAISRFLEDPRQAHSPGNVLLLAGGCSAALSKFSGPAQVIALGVIAFVLLLLNHRKSDLGGLVRLALFAAPIVLLSTGHYYVKNLFLHGSPVFPIKVSFFGISLPGSTDLSGTDILSRATDPTMWRLLLDVAFTAKAGGPAWAITLLGGLAAAAVLALRPTARPLSRVFLAGSGAVLVFFYLKSFYGAGATPNDYFYLENLASLRYATGAITLLVAATCIVAVHHRLLKALLATYLAFDVAGKLISLAALLPVGPYQSMFVMTPSLPWALLFGVVGIGCAALLVRGRLVLRISALLSAAFAMAAVTPAVSSTNAFNGGADLLLKVVVSREHGLAVVTQTPALRALDVGVMASTLYSRGERFKDMVEPIAIEELAARPWTKRPPVLILLCDRTRWFTPERLASLDGALGASGYVRLGANRCAVEYARVPTVARDDLGGLPAFQPYRGDLQCLRADATCSPAAVGTGLLTLSPASAWVWWRDTWRLVQLREGDVLELVDTSAGRIAQLPLHVRFASGLFVPTAETIGRIRDTRSIARVLPATSNLDGWFLTSQGKASISWGGQRGATVLRVTAEEDGAWMGLAARADLARDSGVPLAVIGRVIGSRPADITFFDFEGDARKQFSAPLKSEGNFVLAHDFGSDTGRDYFAAILSNVKRGDVLEIHELALTEAGPVPLNVVLEPK